ncbi:TPA: YicC family protein [Legionella pneumophila subsp. pneumophila]|uniref:YicC/YloC family endoribonuclease n=1 Tax=Legionella sp. PATHC039 TaxID=2992042 RepID=UPI001A283F8A|nr:YicC/YloC family endoribonuclease [Legionella sp. PATHC039]HAT8859508.1 YicC family protein [Legionella pneumophila subsp. pneumophila]MCW8394536.1 YicC family protein [Legionella sp. PATHC039]HAT8934349.1 YicC family protein [Legionella pneumophila subsp. pneumophila]HAT9651136.1 YicC family protein [Legionella pneumophila subsp. pneumophila]HAT9919047.1 YicC family protein [Legionella pneumophila subsp. pneumophila]
MIHSMTAFSRIQKQFDVGDFCWEIRSVNHRYLDVSFRLPESFRFLEAELRSLLRDKIHRGKLECHLKYKDTSCDNRSMLINIGTINALVDLSSKLSASHHLANDMTVSQVLSWPGVVEANPLDMEELSQIALELFQKSIDKLCEVRAGEGRSLQAYVEDRLQALRQEVMKSKSIVVSMSAKTKDKLLTRLHELKMDVPETRIEQEMALLLAKLDVSEELDRLETHIAEVSRTLNAEKVTGRRLDFLMQELNREANTLSSKSDSAELTLCAVEMKVLIEQMREQIQNFE